MHLFGYKLDDFLASWEIKGFPFNITTLKERLLIS